MVTLEYTSHRCELGSRIRQLRVEQGYSTRRFSVMIGISKTYLNRVETAKASPTFEMLERISAGLGVKPSDLVNFENDSQG